MVGLPRPFTTVKWVLLATDAVSICFGAVTVGGCMAARLARLAAVRSNVPDAALCNTIAMQYVKFKSYLDLRSKKLFESKSVQVII